MLRTRLLQEDILEYGVPRSWRHWRPRLTPTTLCVSWAVDVLRLVPGVSVCLNAVCKKMDMFNVKLCFRKKIISVYRLTATYPRAFGSLR